MPADTRQNRDRDRRHQLAEVTTKSRLVFYSPPTWDTVETFYSSHLTTKTSSKTIKAAM
jgi:hypothetical protein